MKTCSICKEPKALSEFQKRSDSRDGLTGKCKACIQKTDALWVQKNKERDRAHKAKWRANNKERHSAYNSKWQKNNPEKRRAKYKRWRENNLEAARENFRKWARENPVLAAMNSKRRGYKVSVATPEWLSSIQIAQMSAYYEVAKAASMQTGCAHHVDHIVPLQGKNVSGLNVPWNLQVMMALANQSKGNKLLEAG